MGNRKIVQLSGKSVRTVGEIYGGKDLWKMNVLSVEWKSDGMMDGESSDDDEVWDDRKRQLGLQKGTSAAGELERDQIIQ